MESARGDEEVAGYAEEREEDVREGEDKAVW